jgi:uncharacterized membrane protein
MHKQRSLTVAIAAAIAGLLHSVDVADASAPIYGGPTYDSTTGSGYQHIGESAPFGPRPTAGNGSAVGTPWKYGDPDSGGTRPVRWDASGAPAIELSALGVGSGFNMSQDFAAAMNSAGTAVGYAEKWNTSSALGTRAVRWNTSGVPTELQSLGTDLQGRAYSYAYAINNAGTAAGSSIKFASNGASLGTVAVRWDASGTAATELGDFGYGGTANVINAAGTIAGQAERYDGVNSMGSRAVRWNASSTTPIELGNIGTSIIGRTDTHAYAINNAGTVVGWAKKFFGDASNNGFLGERAVRWDASGTVATELDILNTDNHGYTDSFAWAINNAGTAVGFVGKFSSDGRTLLGSRAARWDASGTALTELGFLNTATNGYTACYANAINSAGTIAGYAEKYSSDGGTKLGNRAVAWGADGVAVDLNTILSSSDAALWTLTGAGAISDTYWVTGYATFDPDGSAGPKPSYQRDFLLDVISVFGTPADATRDGKVDFDDLVVLSQHYNLTTGQKWDTGDFNGDGAVNFPDLVVLAKRYGQGTAIAEGDFGESFAADWALAQSMVPEPTTLAALAFTAGLLGRRRK